MNLENLTTEQREEYYKQVCEAIGLPPELRLLEFIYMDSGDGARQLVLYALRGATDKLREVHKISVTNLQKDEGDGYVAWIATGTNSSGRTEMAVGAAATRGLTGEKLARAVATAQTRAVRRMVLQFCGIGILDESEVSEATTNLSSVATLPAPTIPTTAVSSEAGRIVASVAPEPDTPTRIPTRPFPTSVESRAAEDVAELETIPQFAPVAVTPERMTPEQSKEIREKLFRYRNEILEPAGLMPSSNCGTHTKMELLLRYKFPEITDLKNVSYAQWGAYFTAIDQLLAKHGPEKAVAFINKTIGTA